MRTISADMATEADEFIPTRQSLLHRLRDWEDEQGWREFFDTYWKFIYGVARKAGLSDAEAQDAVQETIISVARKMPGFVYDAKSGSFKAWLMLVTRRRIADHFRKKQYQSDGQRFLKEKRLDTAMADQLQAAGFGNADGIWEEEWQRNVTAAALERVKCRVDPKQFQLFHLHVARGIPAREVAKRLDAKLPEVYVAKYKVSALLRKQVKLLESRGV